jgi:ABC-type phosphate/phosphonate transport system substrate-binding protein
MFAMSLAACAAQGSVTAADPPAKMRVGISAGLYQHVPETLFKTTFSPVESLIQEQTGLAGELILGGESGQLAEQLGRGQVEFAVFTGAEFAWARQKNTKLQPLVIAVNQDRSLRVHVLVRQDCTATRLADLKDMPLALPRCTLDHCELFLNQQQALCGSSNAPFPKLCRPGAVEDALDEVVDGKMQAAVVDGAAVDSYQHRKPGRFARLKDLHKPVLFPAPVVAYQEGAIDDTALRAFRGGLLKAQQSAKGRMVLTLWKLTRFEKVPDDYPQLLDEVAKTYAAPPPPASASVKK